MKDGIQQGCGPHRSIVGSRRLAVVLWACLLAGTVFARFEWRDVVQDVVIDQDGSVTVMDERTLWTDEAFVEAFICIGHPPRVRVTLLEGSGAVSPGPAARAFQQACESGAEGTEVVLRQDERVQERRIRFVYRFEGTLDVYRDVVQWYWNLIQLDHPPIMGYRLTITAPDAMAAPFDAFVHRYTNPERPRIMLSQDRRVLTVSFDHIPPGDGVEVRYLMDPRLFAATGTESGFSRLLADATAAAQAVRDADAVTERRQAFARQHGVTRMLDQGCDWTFNPFDLEGATVGMLGMPLEMLSASSASFRAHIFATTPGTFVGTVVYQTPWCDARIVVVDVPRGTYTGSELGLLAARVEEVADGVLRLSYVGSQACQERDCEEFRVR